MCRSGSGAVPARAVRRSRDQASRLARVFRPWRRRARQTPFLETSRAPHRSGPARRRSAAARSPDGRAQRPRSAAPSAPTADWASAATGAPAAAGSPARAARHDASRRRRRAVHPEHPTRLRDAGPRCVIEQLQAKAEQHVIIRHAAHAPFLVRQDRKSVSRTRTTRLPQTPSRCRENSGTVQPRPLGHDATLDARPRPLSPPVCAVVCDDSAFMRRMLSDVLRGVGAAVVGAAANGQEGSGRASSRPAAAARRRRERGAVVGVGGDDHHAGPPGGRPRRTSRPPRPRHAALTARGPSRADPMTSGHRPGARP
jgi:hypothetical protein